jgi:hypothetical protein
MLDSVIFEEDWNNIKVSAYTDLYAYDPDNEALIFISLAGNEQAVKSISSAIIACKTVSIRRDRKNDDTLKGHPALRYRITSTKLAGGSLHQIVADCRFYIDSTSESRLVVIPKDTQTHDAIYSQVLAPLASPIIPSWAQWLCDRLLEIDRLKEMAGTLRVVEAALDERIVDDIVSEGIRMGQINFDEQGGVYA